MVPAPLAPPEQGPAQLDGSGEGAALDAGVWARTGRGISPAGNGQGGGASVGHVAVERACPCTHGGSEGALPGQPMPSTVESENASPRSASPANSPGEFHGQIHQRMHHGAADARGRAQRAGELRPLDHVQVLERESSVRASKFIRQSGPSCRPRSSASPCRRTSSSTWKARFRARGGRSERTPGRSSRPDRHVVQAERRRPSGARIGPSRRSTRSDGRRGARGRQPARGQEPNRPPDRPGRPPRHREARDAASTGAASVLRSTTNSPCRRSDPCAADIGEAQLHRAGVEPHLRADLAERQVHEARALGRGASSIEIAS